jgi:hypothetical protein
MTGPTYLGPDDDDLVPNHSASSSLPMRREPRRCDPSGLMEEEGDYDEPVAGLSGDYERDNSGAWRPVQDVRTMLDTPQG